MFDADKYLGTAKDKIEKKLVPGGHIGLFMGARNLKEVWPSIARWIPLTKLSYAVCVFDTGLDQRRILAELAMED